MCLLFLYVFVFLFLFSFKLFYINKNDFEFWIVTSLWCPAAGDLKGAVETLRSLLLFYPTDSVSLSNLELYTQTLEAQETGPMQVTYDAWTGGVTDTWEMGLEE